MRDAMAAANRMSGGRGMEAGGAMRGPMGMRGMGSEMMGPMGMPGMGMNAQSAEMKKQLTLLTRTDFLLSFVWKPVKPEEAPKTDQERNDKIKSLIADMRKAEEKNPAVRIGDIEKKLEAASRQKSDQLDSQMTKAMPGAAAAPGAPGTPGGGAPQPPGGLVPPPPAGTPPGAK
jgi:type IV pilus assembly protein PilM